MKNVNETMPENALKQQIVRLYDLMKTEKIEELEIRENDTYIHLKRKGRTAPAVIVPAAVAPVEVAVQEEVEIPGERIQSPIMGLFYRAASPSSPQFAKEGDIVETGKTLCIVEAMKVMNEIKSDSRMKVLKILVENGKPISAGQDLFIIERA